MHAETQKWSISILALSGLNLQSVVVGPNAFFAAIESRLIKIDSMLAGRSSGIDSTEPVLDALAWFAFVYLRALPAYPGWCGCDCQCFCLGICYGRGGRNIGV